MILYHTDSCRVVSLTGSDKSDAHFSQTFIRKGNETCMLDKPKASKSTISSGWYTGEGDKASLSHLVHEVIYKHRGGKHTILLNTTQKPKLMSTQSRSSLVFSSMTMNMPLPFSSPPHPSSFFLSLLLGTGKSSVASLRQPADFHPGWGKGMWGMHWCVETNNCTLPTLEEAWCETEQKLKRARTNVFTLDVYTVTKQLTTEL